MQQLDFSVRMKARRYKMDTGVGPSRAPNFLLPSRTMISLDEASSAGPVILVFYEGAGSEF
jgi:hypothetical protein